MGKLRPFVRKDSYMPNKKWIPFVIGNGYTTTDGASGPAPEYETVTGNPVSFTAIAAPLKQLEVAFSPVQSGSGDPSPDNVRPISGWDGVDIFLQSAYDPTAQPFISISFGSTVYSGTLDVLTGVVTSTYTYYKLSNVNPSRITAYDVGRKKGVWINYVLNQTVTRIAGLCNMAVVERGASTLPSYMWFGVNSGAVYWVGILDVLGLSSVDEFKTWLANNDVYIAFPSATPQTIQLTPQQVSSLLGENVLFSDANGDLTVEYRSN